MEVANQVAYGGSMLHFKEKPDFGKLVWLDVKTQSENWKDKHFSLDEREKVITLLKELSNKWSPNEIFIISPFKAVSNNLKRDEMISKFVIKENIGTIHTFQGKEADVVILVLGGKTSGAREWAAKKPNLVNVAVTRAKKELYVIGDIEAWRSLPYFNILADFCTVK